MIPKSEVGVLTSDSKNVVQLIESAYNVSCQFATDKFCYFSPFVCTCILKLPFVTNTLLLIIL